MKNTTQNFKALGLAIGFTLLTASAMALDIAPPSRDRDPSPRPDPTPIETSSQSETNDRLKYKVCFYSEENYAGKSFCRRAPSLIGKLSPSLANDTKSIKITNTSGRKVHGPDIQLKLCDKSWRRGECVMLNKSETKISRLGMDQIASYAFKVKRK